MSPPSKGVKTRDRFNANESPKGGKSHGTIASYDKSNLERKKNPVLEPSIWRTLGRLLHEFVVILFFISTHWIIKLWLLATQQQNELWVRYLIDVSIIFATTTFTIIFGAEMIGDCAQAIRFLKRRWQENK
jgi:hypothetical protein